MKNHYIKLITENINTIKGKIRYYENALNHDLEPWEFKEYSHCLADARELLQQAEAHLSKVMEEY